MEKYRNFKGFENTNNGNQLKHSVYTLTNLNIIFYNIPILFIEYEMDNPISVHENTHIFTEIDDFVLFLKIYTNDFTSIEYENLNDILEYYGHIINMYFKKHKLDITDYLT